MPAIQSKTFVVGVPRSGTTLVQTILAAHPNVYATRETHLMVNSRRPPSFRWYLDYVWLSRERVRGAVAHLKADCPDLYEQYVALQPRSTTVLGAARMIDTLFSAAAQARQQTAWVEKSPEHVGYVPVLERAVPDAHFVHTIRDPRDNVASLYDAGQKYADRWQGRQTLDQCIRTYLRYLQKSEACLSRDPQRHHFVIYENIIEQPEAQTTALLNFVGLKRVNLDLATIDSGNAALSRDTEEWKKERGPGIQDTRLVKYHKLFDAAQQRQVEEQTMEQYENIVAQAAAR